MSKKLAGAFANRVVYFSIKNRDAARKVAGHLVKSSNDSIILPFIDYPMPLSAEILSREFRSLTICESDGDKREKFQEYISREKYIRNVKIYSDDLFDLSFKTHCDTAQSRCANIVKDIGTGPDPETGYNNVKFLVPLLKSKYEGAFLKNLYYQFCCKLGLCSKSLVHYYFLMSDRQHAYMNSRPSENMRLYRSSTVLYNTIFNIKTLESFDLKTCFGITVRKLQNTAANNNSSYKSVHLVWLEPRLGVINTMNPQSLVEFRFLVTQMMHKPTGLVHKFLGKSFNNFEFDLKHLGIDEQTRCGDLDKEQYYKLFLYLRSRDDYRNSTFLQAVASYDDTILSL